MYVNEHVLRDFSFYVDIVQGTKTGASLLRYMQGLRSTYDELLLSLT